MKKSILRDYEKNDRLLLHASAVIRKGRLHLFCGPSGPGKTTIAVELNGGGEVFSVDSVALSMGKEGRVQAESTPFPNEIGQLLVVVPILFRTSHLLSRPKKPS